MKLKKLVLKHDQRIMTTEEMRNITGGLTKANYCSMNGGQCSGYCENKFDGKGGVYALECKQIKGSAQYGGSYCICM